MDDDNPITEIPETDCWERLESHEFGRLAYHLLNEVHIVPINYAAYRGTIFFRTAEGSKLIGVVMNHDVAFEIDDLTGGERAWSVVARGHARKLEEDEAHITEQLPLRPWVDTIKENVVCIEVAEVSGRTFDLHRPWLRVRND